MQKILQIKDAYSPEVWKFIYIVINIRYQLHYFNLIISITDATFVWHETKYNSEIYIAKSTLKFRCENSEIQWYRNLVRNSFRNKRNCVRHFV